jgi:hypothetical protein
LCFKISEDISLGSVVKLKIGFLLDLDSLSAIQILTFKRSSSGSVISKTEGKRIAMTEVSSTPSNNRNSPVLGYRNLF